MSSFPSLSSVVSYELIPCAGSAQIDAVSVLLSLEKSKDLPVTNRFTTKVTLHRCVIRFFFWLGFTKPG